MEHLVQFGVSFDDAQLRKRLEENAYDDICNRIVYETIQDLPNKNKYGNNPRKPDQVNWKSLVEDKLYDFISDHKDEIIDLAAEKLVASYTRSKAYRDRKSVV